MELTMMSIFPTYVYTPMLGMIAEGMDRKLIVLVCHYRCPSGSRVAVLGGHTTVVSTHYTYWNRELSILRRRRTPHQSRSVIGLSYHLCRENLIQKACDSIINWGVLGWLPVPKKHTLVVL